MLGGGLLALGALLIFTGLDGSGVQVLLGLVVGVGGLIATASGLGQLRGEGWPLERPPEAPPDRPGQTSGDGMASALPLRAVTPSVAADEVLGFRRLNRRAAEANDKAEVEQSGS